MLDTSRPKVGEMVEVRSMRNVDGKIVEVWTPARVTATDEYGIDILYTETSFSCIPRGMGRFRLIEPKG